MTYVKSMVTKRYAPHRRRSNPPLSDWWDDFKVAIFGPVGGVIMDSGGDTSDCLNTANATFAPLDAQINDLAKTWNPTGFYVTSDIRSLVSTATALTQQAFSALGQAQALGTQSGSDLANAVGNLNDALAKGQIYLQAASQADAQGLRTVNAAGLKDWVLNTMGATENAMITASVVMCIQPAWVGIVSAFKDAFNTLISVAKAVVGAVIAAGEQALKVADTLQTISTVATVAAIGLAGWWLYNNYVVTKGRRA